MSQCVPVVSQQSRHLVRIIDEVYLPKRKKANNMMKQQNGRFDGNMQTNAARMAIKTRHSASEEAQWHETPPSLIQMILIKKKTNPLINQTTCEGTAMFVLHLLSACSYGCNTWAHCRGSVGGIITSKELSVSANLLMAKKQKANQGIFFWHPEHKLDVT